MLSRGERKPDKDDVNKFAKQLPVIPYYWFNLELRFHEVLREYTHERDPDDIICQWLKSVRDTLLSAWEQHRASVSMGDAWAIRSLVKAEEPVRHKLKKLNEEISKLEPNMEVAI
jgi:CRISPR system Cascade subunit CasA